MAAKGVNTTKYALDWDRLLQVAKQEIREGDRDLGLYIAVSIYTGLRSKELLNLKLQNVFVEGTVPTYLNIYQSKNKKYRKISVAPGLREILLTSGRMTGYILRGRDGGPMAPQWVNAKIKALGAKYNLAMAGELSTHALRKTFARRIIDKNPGKEEWALVLLSDIFGHSSTAITRRYVGIRQREVDVAYNSL